MTQPYGIGWSCTSSLTDPAVMVGGFQIVAEAIVRRWQTPRGGLIDDPNYGYDLTEFINADIDKAALAQIAHLAGAEAQKDERVAGCKVTITFNNGVFSVLGKVTLAAGPTFDLVVTVDKVTVTLLQVSAT